MPSQMKHDNLKTRTKKFALQVIAFVTALPKTDVAREIGRQLLRSGTSVGANYRAACRPKSRPDFISKIADAEEEADESAYWLELLLESKISRPEDILPLLDEAGQLAAIMAASGNTARSKSTQQLPTSEPAKGAGIAIR